MDASRIPPQAMINRFCMLCNRLQYFDAKINIIPLLRLKMTNPLQPAISRKGWRGTMKVGLNPFDLPESKMMTE
jgi:hypothetical protein